MDEGISRGFRGFVRAVPLNEALSIAESDLVKGQTPFSFNDRTPAGIRVNS